MSAPISHPPPHDAPPGEHPPGAMVIARRLAHLLARPLERFLAIEAASGIILIVVAAVALGWANSPWAASYERAWTTPLGLSFGTHAIRASTHLVVNDGLMTIFFLVVGLEIRRELHAGELSDRRRAALPVVAAVGGMLAPAAIFMLAASHGAAARGWGVPMATDIAFAVGVLALLGRRVPPALRVLLLALAIIDDLGAILVIAIFYSSGVDGTGIAIAAGALAGFGLLHAIGARAVGLYLVPAVALWIGVARAGVHPTIAGVITGLLIPTEAWPGREDQSPGARLEHALHPWVAYAIMPLFALANAGVDLSGVHLGASPGIVLGVGAGLVLGKPLGIVAACALAVRLRVAALPRGVTWRGILVVGAVGGIGFTMALFIAQLAFPAHPELHAVAKLSVLGASAVAALIALIVGRILLPTTHAEGTATSVDDAERAAHV